MRDPAEDSLLPETTIHVRDRYCHLDRLMDYGVNTPNWNDQFQPRMVPGQDVQ